METTAAPKKIEGGNGRREREHDRRREEQERDMASDDVMEMER